MHLAFPGICDALYAPKCKTPLKHQHNLGPGMMIMQQGSRPKNHHATADTGLTRVLSHRGRHCCQQSLKIAALHEHEVVQGLAWHISSSQVLALLVQQAA